MKTSLNFLKSICTFVFMTLASTSFAGTALINGQGEARAMPEFVSLSIDVKSECYKTAADASKGNDALANRILNLLRGYANISSGDLVTASGGYVSRYSGYDPRTNLPICVRTFRKENRLTLKIHNLQSFPQIFANIQDEIYGMGIGSVGETVESPTDYAEISTPLPGVTESTFKMLERQALMLALQDAKEKFEVTMALAGVSKYHISKYSENLLVTHDQAEKVSRSHDSTSDPAPIQFGKLEVSKILFVEFTYSHEALRLQQP